MLTMIKFKNLTLFDFLVVSLPPILLPFSTNNIELSENLLFKNDANVQVYMPAPMTEKL